MLEKCMSVLYKPVKPTYIIFMLEFHFQRHSVYCKCQQGPCPYIIHKAFFDKMYCLCICLDNTLNRPRYNMNRLLFCYYYKIEAGCSKILLHRNQCSNNSMEVYIHALLGSHDRQTNQRTNQETDSGDYGEIKSPIITNQ